MTRPEPAQQQRRDRREHIARLARETSPTTSQRALLVRLRRFDDDDSHTTPADLAPLRAALGLATDAAPSTHHRRGADQ